MIKHVVVASAALAVLLGFGAQAASVASIPVAAKPSSVGDVQKVADISTQRPPRLRGTRAYRSYRHYGYGAYYRPYRYGLYYRPYRYGYYWGYRRRHPGRRWGYLHGRYGVGRPGMRRTHIGVTRHQAAPSTKRSQGTRAMTPGQGSRAMNRGTGAAGGAPQGQQGQGQGPQQGGGTR